MYPDEKKSKRKKRIIIFSLLIILIALIWFFFFRGGKNQSVKERLQNLFPFGEVVSRKEKSRVEKESGEEKVEESGKEEKRAFAPRLRQITTFPTGGFAPLNRVHPELVKDIVVNAQGEKQEITREIQVEDDAVRYSDIEKGNIFESKLDPYEIKKKLLAEEFIPDVEYAFFAPDGNHVAFQYWNTFERTPETYLGKISKKQPDVQPCPYTFKNVELGDEGDEVMDLHKFLNEDPRTRISLSGINSPGNEGNVVVPETISAIKNFQAIYNLDIDGKVGGETKKKMEKICNEREEKKAEEKLRNEKTQYDVEGFFLPKGIVTLSISPDSKELFTLGKTKTGSIGKVRDFETGKEKIVFNSPFKEWLSQWNNNQNIQLTTKASYITDSYTYGLDPNTGKYHKTLPQAHGLTTLASPDNKKVFIHLVDDKKSKNYIYFNDEKQKIILTKVHTLPEKCAWTHDSQFLYCLVPTHLEKDGEYPDHWYQGLELFSDQLWKIDGNTTEETLVSDIPVEYGKQLDGWKLGIDPKSHYLYFIDKGSETLWSYRLYDPAE